MLSAQTTFRAVTRPALSRNITALQSALESSFPSLSLQASVEGDSPSLINRSANFSRYISNVSPLPRRCFSTVNAELEEEHPPGWELIHSPPTKGRYPRGSLVGKVVSDKMDKTVNVAVERYRIVPKYRKRMRYTRKFMAHDEEEECNLGDVVLITPCQRKSKLKHFVVKEIIRKKPQL